MSLGPGHGGERRGYAHDPDRFGGLTVPDPAYSSDDGSADLALAAVLAAHASGAAGSRDVVAALAGRRLMVPLVSVLDEAEAGDHGLAQEKSSHLATVSLLMPDGRRALLAFTGVAAMAAWDPDARGIPADAGRVAAAALDEKAQAVLLDMAGPVRTAVQGFGLGVLASGAPWPEPYADPAVVAAVRDAMARLPGIAAHTLTAGADGADLTVLLRVEPGIDDGDLARRVAQALAVEQVVVERCPGGVDVGLLA